MHIDSTQLIDQLSLRVERSFAQDAIDSYIGMEKRFLAGDWKPAELDGGRLCEAVSRAIYQLDGGIVDHDKLPGAIRVYLVEQKNVSHQLSRQDRFHIAKAIEVVYKFRSDRGAVHISPVHTANFMDSVYVLHAGKWILAEFLRIAWNQDSRVIGEVISQLVQLEHSVVHELDGRPMVVAKDLTIGEEILLLLYNAPSNRLSRSEIREYVVNRNSQSVASAISRMSAAREIRVASNGDIALTPNGHKRVLEQIMPKVRNVS
jgi:hypothetical protein